MRARSLGAFGVRAVAAGLVVAGGAIGALSLAPTQAGCAGKAPPPAAPDPILIGASLGLTNGLAGTGSAQRDALLAAQGQINASGGLLGRQVRFEIEDDASDEKGVVTRVANDLVAKGVVAVIGPIGSSQVLAVQDIYRQAQIIEISASATSTALTTVQPTTDRWLFRTTPADDFQGAAVMLYAQRTPRGLGDAGAPMMTDGGPIATCSKLAIVQIDNAYGGAMSDVIEQNWPKRTGKNVLAREKIPVDLASDYKSTVDAVYTAAGGPPQCLAFIMYEDTGAEFIREFKADARFASLPNGFFFIGTDGVYDDTFLKNARANPSDPTGPNVAEGVTGTTPDSQPGTPEYEQFRTIYASYDPAFADKDAPPFASNAYDAAMLVALAIAKAGTVTDRVAVRNALLDVANPPGKTYGPAQYLDALQAIQQGLDIDYKGASGNVDLEPNGNVKSGFAVWQAYRKSDKTLDFQTIGRFELVDLLAQIQ